MADGDSYETAEEGHKTQEHMITGILDLPFRSSNLMSGTAGRRSYLTTGRRLVFFQS